MPYLGKQPVNIIKDNAVSTNKIVDDAVTNAKVAPNAIDTTELADNSVETAKINANAVTDAKLNDNAVTTNKITDLNVTQGKLAAEAVSEAKLHAGNAPTDNYVLTAASGQTGGLIWSSPAIVSGWNTVIEQTEANGNRFDNVSQLDITLSMNKRYKIELSIYRYSGSPSYDSIKTQWSDDQSTNFLANSIFGIVERGDTMASAHNNGASAPLTWDLGNIGNGNAATGVQGTWEYEQLFRSGESQKMYAMMWGHYIGNDSRMHGSHVFVNTTHEIDLLRLSLTSANNFSGDIRVLRRD